MLLFTAPWRELTSLIKKSLDLKTSFGSRASLTTRRRRINKVAPSGKIVIIHSSNKSVKSKPWRHRYDTLGPNWSSTSLVQPFILVGSRGTRVFQTSVELSKDLLTISFDCSKARQVEHPEAEYGSKTHQKRAQAGYAYCVTVGGRISAAKHNRRRKHMQGS